MHTSIETGRATAAVKDAVVTPHDRVSRRPVVFLHSLNGTAPTPFLTSPAQQALITAIVEAGFTVVVPTIGALWGIGATFATRMTDILAWARSAAYGCSNATPVIVGVSAGAGAGLNYCADHPADVAGFVGMIPAVDYQAIRVSDPYGLGIQASLDAAAGVTYPAALPAGTDPATRTGALVAVRQQLWTASDDLVSANAATYATAVGAELHDLGALAHTEAALAQVVAATMVAFIQSLP